MEKRASSLEQGSSLAQHFTALTTTDRINWREELHAYLYRLVALLSSALAAHHAMPCHAMRGHAMPLSCHLCCRPVFFRLLMGLPSFVFARILHRRKYFRQFLTSFPPLSFTSFFFFSCPPVGAGGATGARVRGRGLRRPRVRHDAPSGRRFEGDRKTELQGGSGLLLEGAEHGQELVHRQVGRGRTSEGICLGSVCFFVS